MFKKLKCTDCGKVLTNDLKDNFKASDIRKSNENQRYVLCNSCNCVMLGDYQGLTLKSVISTPTEDTPGTRKMVKEALELFKRASVTVPDVSFTKGGKVLKKSEFDNIEDDEDELKKQLVEETEADMCFECGKKDVLYKVDGKWICFKCKLKNQNSEVKKGLEIPNLKPDRDDKDILLILVDEVSNLTQEISTLMKKVKKIDKRLNSVNKKLNKLYAVAADSSNSIKSSDLIELITTLKE
jgi:hypothetical protein